MTNSALYATAKGGLARISKKGGSKKESGDGKVAGETAGRAGLVKRPIVSSTNKGGAKLLPAEHESVARSEAKPPTSRRPIEAGALEGCIKPASKGQQSGKSDKSKGLNEAALIRSSKVRPPKFESLKAEEDFWLPLEGQGKDGGGRGAPVLSKKAERSQVALHAASESRPSTSKHQPPAMEIPLNDPNLRRIQSEGKGTQHLAGGNKTSSEPLRDVASPPAGRKRPYGDIAAGATGSREASGYAVTVGCGPVGCGPVASVSRKDIKRQKSARSVFAPSAGPSLPAKSSRPPPAAKGGANATTAATAHTLAGAVAEAAASRQPPPPSSLMDKMAARLQGGRFRSLNEALYTQVSL